MKTIPNVFATDRVNRNRIRIPDYVLMESIERTHLDSLDQICIAGMPANISHDMERAFGWTIPQGIYIDANMARAISEFHVPASTQERDWLCNQIDKFWNKHHHKHSQPHSDELIRKLGSVSVETLEILMLEAVAAKADNLAKQVFPEFFKEDSVSVIK